MGVDDFMEHVNIFDTKTDEELLTLYNQFLEAEKCGRFFDGNELGKIKREYENDFGAKTTLIIQIGCLKRTEKSNFFLFFSEFS